MTGPRLDGGEVAALGGLLGGGPVLLGEVERFVRRYVRLSDDQAAASTLWIAHTHAVEAAFCTPYLSITSPEKESGKTRLLEVLELLAARPWKTGRTTAAALVRKLDSDRATLLLDESDAAFNGDREYAEALRGALDEGHRRGGRATVCVGAGANIAARDFSVFGPKAIAGIGRLPDTVAARAIPVRMRRRRRDEPVERFRWRRAREQAGPLRERLEAFAGGCVEVLAGMEPELPDELSDRQMDVWEPLVAIAEVVGGGWPRRARLAAVGLAGQAAEDQETLATQLLEDLAGLFAERDRLTTRAILDELVEFEHRPWGDYRAGRPLSAPGLARLLRPFEIRPRTVKLPDGTSAKGYLAEQFADAFSRYLAPCPRPANVTPSQPAPDAGLRPIGKRHRDVQVTAGNRRNPALRAEGDGVTASNAGQGVEGRVRDQAEAPVCRCERGPEVDGGDGRCLRCFGVVG